MQFTFQESLPHPNTTTVDPKRKPRKVTAKNESAARARLPKAFYGTVWRLVKAEGDKPKPTVLRTGEVILSLPQGTVPLKDADGNIIGQATIDPKTFAVTGQLDLESREGRRMHRMIRAQQMIEFSLGIDAGTLYNYNNSTNKEK